MGNFAQTCNGRERWDCGAHIPRHRHDRAYAAIILSGAYEECGTRGRFRVRGGDVLLHGAFDAHLDRFRKGGAQILNLTLNAPPDFALGRVSDPDTIARAAEKDCVEASARLCAQLLEAKPAGHDWQDELANDLLGDPDCRLDEWARAHNLAPETISRGFGKVFGLTPAAFRLEARARCAFAMIAGSAVPLASIAAQTGFADQAHMSRAIRVLTGMPPGRWRRSNPFKTELPCAA